MDRSGYFKGIKLCGKVEKVTSFPDIKVQVVDSFPDLNVKVVVNSKFKKDNKV